MTSKNFLENLLRNYNANPFHPEIADLIDARMISAYNACILAKLPTFMQLSYRKEAMALNATELEALINKNCKSNLMLDKNILVTLTDDVIHYALVPLSELMKGLPHLDINDLNGCTVYDDTVPPNVKDDIITLFQRFGIVEYDPAGSVTDDLKKYLHPIPPFKVDDILSISM